MNDPFWDACHLLLALLAIFGPIAFAGWLLRHRPPTPSTPSKTRKTP